MKRFLAILAILTVLCGSRPLFAGPPPAPAPVSVLCGTCQVTLAVTSTSARVALPSTAATNVALTIYNAGAKDAYVNQGDSAVTATTSNVRIPAGASVTIWASGVYVAGITAGGDTSSLYIYQANGPVLLSTIGGGVIVPVSGTVTSNQGAAGSAAWPMKIDQTTSGTTNGVVVNSSALPGGAATAANQTATQTTLAPGTAPASAMVVGCQYRASPTAPADTQTQAIPCGQYGITMNGNVASGAADVGMPVKVGGKYNSTLPTFTDGQRGDMQITAKGAGVTTLFSSGGTVINSSTPGDGQSGATGIQTISSTMLYNGANALGDRAFTCTQTAAVNVTAGSTTQIVALSGSTVIRVCSFSVSMSTAGTAAWSYGTGSNCGTGNTAITPAVPLATATPWTVSSGSGSVLRSASGNVVGFVTYVQY